MHVYSFSFSIHCSYIFFSEFLNIEIILKKSTNKICFFYCIEDSQTYAHADAKQNSDLAWPNLQRYPADICFTG